MISSPSLLLLLLLRKSRVVATSLFLLLCLLLLGIALGKPHQLSEPQQNNNSASSDDVIGMGYIRTWKENQQIYCSPTPRPTPVLSVVGLNGQISWQQQDEPRPAQLPPLSSSKVTCWQHPNTGKDSKKAAFCGMENVAIDFDKFHTPENHEHGGEPGSYDVGKGAIRGRCELKIKALPMDSLMVGTRDLMRSFEAMNDYDDRHAAAAALQCAAWVDHPVYFVSLRKWHHNLYHTMTEYFNAFVASRVTGIPISDWQAVIMDENTPVPTLDQGWKDIISPNHPLLWRKPDLELRQRHAGGPLCFRKAIFSIHGLQSMLFWFPYDASPYRNSELVREFRDHVLDSYGLKQRETNNNKKEDIIWITFILRRDYGGRTITRKIENEDQVVEMIQGYVQAKNNELETASQQQQQQQHHPTTVRIRFVDVVNMTLREQIELMQDTDILMGVHGAALTLSLFLPYGSVLVEFPDGVHALFENFAHWLGIDYLGCGQYHGRREWVVLANKPWILEKCINESIDMALKSKKQEKEPVDRKNQ